MNDQQVMTELAAITTTREYLQGIPVNAPNSIAPPAVEEENDFLRSCLSDIAKGNQAALESFYDATISRVYGVALRIVSNQMMAEEAVSDVYMQVWRNAKQYDISRGRVLGWLMVMARSRSLDLLRRQDEAFNHPEPNELVQETGAGNLTPHDLLAASEANVALHAALSRLSPLQRQLLSLAFFKGLSHSEIVEHSGLPLGSVKTHIRRALGLLRDALGPDMEPKV